jgi:tetratricopeptide (TPR) repeat protein
MRPSRSEDRTAGSAISDVPLFLIRVVTNVRAWCAQWAVDRSRKRNNPLSLAHAVRHLGDVHHDAGRAALAERCYQEALALYRGHSQTEPGDLANAIRPLAVLKEDAGEIEEADRFWQEAHDLYASCRAPAGVAECAAHLALHARRRDDSRGSRDWLSRAIAAADESKDPDSLEFVREVRALIEERPATPEQDHRLALDLLRVCATGDAAALRRISEDFGLEQPPARGRLQMAMLRRLSARLNSGTRMADMSLADVQWLVARSRGYRSWHCW